MSLAFGHDFLAIPGPSVIPDRVLRAMHRAAPNIYEGELVDMVAPLYADLCKIARCSAHVAVYHGNGHAAWEASLCNTHSAGDTALFLLTGRFGRGWMDMAEAIGIKTIALDFGAEQPVDIDQLCEVLNNDSAHEIKSVFAVHTDTASSVRNDVMALRNALDACGHPALLQVDCIASLGCEPFDMDAWGVDVVVAACQKGLMTPPGLAFTFCSERALAQATESSLNTAYWDWQRRINGSFFHQKFCGTPPTHLFYGLQQALQMLHEEGLDNVWRRHQAIAEAVWSAIDVWSEGEDLGFQVPLQKHRSIAVTTIAVKSARGNEIRDWCASQAGLTLGVGLELEGTVGGQTDRLFRIGHMGHLNPPMILGTLATVDTSLKALGISHGNGAIEAATRSIAEILNKPN